VIGPLLFGIPLAALVLGGVVALSTSLDRDLRQCGGGTAAVGVIQIVVTVALWSSCTPFDDNDCSSRATDLSLYVPWVLVGVSALALVALALMLISDRRNCHSAS
jgi:hypothetical protein